MTSNIRTNRQASELDAASNGAGGVEFIEQSELEDDYTVADMSMLERYPRLPNMSSRDIREELGDPDDRRALIFGATWAGLSIGLVYIVVFGLVILLMVLLWN